MSGHYSKSAVRASLLHFMFGKALNAVVSLATIVLLARWIAPADYGVYIAFMALQVTMLAASTFGIETTTERFLPELRTRHADHELLGFVLAALLSRIGTLVLMAAVCWLAAAPITAAVGVPAQAAAFRIWALVVLLSGALAMAVALQEAMLHQRHAQQCMTVYTFGRLLLLLAAHQFGQLDLALLVWIELAANGVAALIALALVLRRFGGGTWRAGWAILQQHRVRMQRFALFNYSAQVIFQFFNAEVMKLLVTRLLGVLQAARYGFVYSLADTVQRYLPAVLLLRMIKPVFVSRYTQTGDFVQLNRMARIILKLNLLLLAPAIAVAAAYGDDLLSLVSGGKYGDAHWLLVGVLCLLIPVSHQQVLSLLASTLERNAMQLYAGLASTVAFPCALLLLPRLGPYGAIASSAVSGLIYNVFATYYLRRAGYDYRPDARGAGAFLLAGLVLYALAALLRQWWPGWGGMLLAVALGMIAYLLLVRLLGAFSSDERAMLNSVLPKKVFVF
jgi:O-antigen/teichoic acid export membrane protein